MIKNSGDASRYFFGAGRWRCGQVVAALLIGALPGACGQEESAQLTLTGSSTIAPLAAEIGKRFEAENPGTRIDVQTGGSSRGIADARSGLADVGMASRALEAEEQDLLAHTIALDGVSMIVHARNPVKKLSDSQIRALYTGRIRNWRKLGGRDAPVVIVNKAQGRSTLELFVEYFGLDERDIEASVVIGDNEQGIKTVAGNPNAIGYVSIGSAEFAATHGRSIKLLPLDGVKASVANVRARKFPLTRPLNLVTKAPPQGLARRYIEFAQSDAVHDIVESLYFVPIPTN